MNKTFNTDGYCDPAFDYMADLSGRLKDIKAMIDAGKYFTITKARQYGKTTILNALANYLEADYEVISLDFQEISSLSFENEQSFVAAFSEELLDNAKKLPDNTRKALNVLAEKTAAINSLQALFKVLKSWCAQSDREIVLIIDEADTAANNQVFIDFLAQLRACYLKRRKMPVFKSVILAGLYDVRNIKKKIQPDEGHKTNSPWNIAADFLVDLSFSADDIRGMLKKYEADYNTGMDTGRISELIYNYTSGYPYLVSRLCKLIDERITEMDGYPDKSSAWTKAGFLEALKIAIDEINPLYQSLKGKLEEYPELKTVLYELLFTGKPIPYTLMNDYIESAAMFGFIKNVDGTVVISNRIFETVLYNWFISEEYINSKIYNIGVQEKNQFITGGHLDVKKILVKFIETFDYLYGDRDETFLEDAGRRYFMLFLKPIINGTGNCYVEPETRNHERMDLVIDYHGEQSIIEMKVWRGNAYNERGEAQLSAYLDYFHLKKGYMLSFNFNKKKEIGVKEIVLGDKILIEATV